KCVPDSLQRRRDGATGGLGIPLVATLEIGRRFRSLPMCPDSSPRAPPRWFLISEVGHSIVMSIYLGRAGNKERRLFAVGEAGQEARERTVLAMTNFTLFLAGNLAPGQ